jgi:hypothetical protein
MPAAPPAPGVYALRQKAALLGHNTPPWNSMSETFRYEYIAAVTGTSTGGT